MAHPQTHSLGCWFRFARDQLGDIDAGILCSTAFETKLIDLFTRGDCQAHRIQVNRLKRYIERRQLGEPIAYIVRQRGFWKYDFEVTPATLIPRPETESLLETILPYVSNATHVLELGTGCGALGISLALASSAKIYLTDVSRSALRVASGNAERLGANVEFIHSNWYEDVEGSFDCILSNPPYVASNDPHLMRGDLRFEPLLALNGGDDGLESLRIVIGEAPRYLESRGHLAVEHGFDQKDAVNGLFKAAGFTAVELIRDLSGHPRVTHGVGP